MSALTAPTSMALVAPVEEPSTASDADIAPIPSTHAKGISIRELPAEPSKGGRHEFAAAGFPFSDDIGGGCNARLGASGDACGWGGQYKYAKRRAYSGFLRHMGAPIARLRAAAIGSRSGVE